MTELKSYMDIHESDVVCITESHFSNELFDAEVHINGYTSFRADRNFKLDRSVNDNIISSKGGSVIYVKDSLKTKRVEQFMVLIC